MIRKLIITFTTAAVILGGFGLPNGTLFSLTNASDDMMAMSDCASMMSMSGDQETMDCGSMSDDGGQNLPAKCSFKDCSLRSCSVSVFQIAVSQIAYPLKVGPAEFRLDVPLQVFSTGKPPLPPPRSSILA